MPRGTIHRGTIGVDLGGTNLKLALLDGDNQIVERAIVPTQGAEGHDAVLARITDGIGRLRSAAPSLDVAGIGVGVPGEVDMARGVTIELPNLPGRWVDVAVAQPISLVCGLPVGVINDAKAFALAELRIGAASGAGTALLVTVGTGVGGAVIAHGQIVYGVGSAAGEIGHLILLPGGHRCTCGNLGCLETLASGPAIAGEAMRMIVQGFSTSLTDLSAGDLNAITPELVARAADEGDAVAIDIVDRAGNWLGIALAGAIALLAPEVVVIGGGVAPAGSRYVHAAVASAKSHTGILDVNRVDFRDARLGYDAGVIGAALWGRDYAMEHGAQV
ncbi:MAG: ROK family protein [Chloroflexia bacterium]|nr:ROK family protein [Chloroflexia bacterium]